MRVQGEHGYVLHARPYSETSLLLDAFARGHGRLTLVAKGAKRGKSRLSGLLRPFQPLLVSWSGKGEVLTLTGAEPAAEALALRGRSLLCAYYMNELLVRLLHRHDAHAMLYDAYQEGLRALAASGAEEATLRAFETALLRELGYALVLDHEAGSRVPIVDTRRYVYVPDLGPVAETVAPRVGIRVHGATLRDLRSGQLSSARSARESKVLMRALLNGLLDGRPLHSRRLLQRMRPACDPAGEQERTPATSGHSHRD